MTPPGVHADPTYLALSSPLSRPWHFTVLELVVLGCFALTARHVVAEWKKGARHHAFQWLAILVYGVVMELIAFNYIQSYDHAIFTVQLYHRELPLYIPCVYIVLHYTGLEMAQRLGLRALPEALLAGFAMCLLDIPFDLAGASLGWWVWRDTDPNLAFRWLGVPINSYYWYLLFGGVLSLLVRAVRGRFEKGSFAVYAAFAPLIAVGVVALGTLSFLPFHVLKALGVRDDVIVLAHLFGATALALGARAPDAAPLPRGLFAIVVSLCVFDIVALAVAAPRDGTVAAKLAMSVAATAGSVFLARRLVVGGPGRASRGHS